MPDDNPLAGMQDPEEFPPDTLAPPPTPSASVLAGSVATNAQALSAANPAPTKPGSWAKAIQGGVQNMLAGIHNSPGGLFYQASEGARADIARNQQQKQQQFENQQKLSDAARQQQIADATIAEANARKLYQQKQTATLEYDNRRKSYDLDKTMAQGFLQSGAPVIEDGIDSDEIQRLLQQGKLSGHKYVPLVTGEVPVIGDDGQPSFDDAGNPVTRPTYTVFDPRAIPNHPLSEAESKIISDNTPFKLPPGTPVGGVLFAHLSQLAASNQTAKLMIDQQLQNARLGDAVAQDDLAAQRARPKWTAALSKAGGDLNLALQHLQTTDPQAAAVIPRLYATDKESGDENFQKLVDEQTAQKQKQQELAQKEKEKNIDFTGNPEAVGDAFRNSLSPDARGVIDQIGQGRAPLNNPGYLLARKPEIMGAVEKAYPGFDASKVWSYQKTYQDFTSGKTSEALISGATALEHLAELQELNTLNSRNPLSAAYKAYQNKVDTVAAELARFYGNTTEQGIKSYRDTLNGLLNRNAAISTQARSMGDRLDNLETEWKNAAPSSAYQAPMPGISEAAKQARAKLDPAYATKIGANVPAGIAPGSIQMAAPGGQPHWIPPDKIDEARKRGATPVQ